MTTVLKITGWSGGEIDLVSDTYSVDTERWVPSVATRKQSRLAGAIYTDVSEHIPIKIEGATATAILASAGDLVAAIDQAMRWTRGENVDAVVLEYKPDRSASTSNYKAVITGSSNTNIMAQLTSSFHNIVRNGYALLSLPLTRRGLWSGDTDTATSGSAEAPLVVSGSFTNDDPLATPTNIAATITAGGGAIDIYNTESYILATNAASKIDVINASSNMIGSYWFSTSDSKSRTGSVLLCKPVSSADPIWFGSGWATLSIPSDSRSVAIFANIKNTGVLDVKIRATIAMSDASITTSSITIPVSAGIEWRYIGSVSSLYPMTLVRIEMFRAADVAYEDTQIEIDDVVCLSTDGEDWAVLKSNAQPDISSSATHVYNALHRYAEDIIPSFRLGSSTPLIHEGTPFFNLTGDTVAMAFLSASPATDYWQLVSGSTPVTSSFVATKERGFLIPI